MFLPRLPYDRRRNKRLQPGWRSRQFQHVAGKRVRVATRATVINPVSVRGTPIPGFPTRDNLTTHSVEISDIHTFSATLNNSFRVTFLRYIFDFDRRLNQTPPSALGFDFTSASSSRSGAAVFQPVRVFAHRRGHHRPSRFSSEQLWGTGGIVLDEGSALGALRHRVFADAD